MFERTRVKYVSGFEKTNVSKTVQHLSPSVGENYNTVTICDPDLHLSL